MPTVYQTERLLINLHMGIMLMIVQQWFIQCHLLASQDTRCKRIESGSKRGKGLCASNPSAPFWGNRYQSGYHPSFLKLPHITSFLNEEFKETRTKGDSFQTMGLQWSRIPTTQNTTTKPKTFCSKCPIKHDFVWTSWPRKWLWSILV